MSILSRDDVHLIDYLRILYKRRFFVAIVLLAAVGGAAWSTSRQTPIYQATARVLVDNEATIVEFRGVRQHSRAALGTEVHIMRSLEVAEHAVATRIAPELEREDPAFSSLVNQLRASTSVDIAPNTLLLEVRVHADDPGKARRWCDAIAESYVELNFEWRKSQNAAGIAAIKDEASAVKQDLEFAERRLMAYRLEHKGGQSIGEDSETAAALRHRTTAKIEASREAIDAGNKYQALKRWYESNRKALLPLPPDLAPSPLLIQYYKDIAEKRQEVRSLRTKYREKHPKVEEAKTELAQLEASFDAEIEKSLEVLKNQADVYLSIGRAHEGEMETERRKLMDQYDQEFEFQVLQREVDAKNELYKALYAKIGELGVERSIVRNNVRVIERAQALPFPVRPNWRFNLLVGLAFGLAVAVGGVFFLEYLDNTLKTPDDVARFLELPVLAVVPIARKELLAAPEETPRLGEGEKGASAA